MKVFFKIEGKIKQPQTYKTHRSDDLQTFSSGKSKTLSDGRKMAPERNVNSHKEMICIRCGKYMDDFEVADRI